MKNLFLRFIWFFKSGCSWGKYNAQRDWEKELQEVRDYLKSVHKSRNYFRERCICYNAELSKLNVAMKKKTDKIKRMKEKLNERTSRTSENT
jgi:chromosome segregation ATPase